MGITSTKMIRDYIDANLSEFDRTLLETKSEYIGTLNNKNTDIIALPSGEEVVVGYVDISITGTDRAKPQIRVFMDKTREAYQYARDHQKRFFLLTIFSKENAMAKNIVHYDPHDYILAIETNIDNETSRRDLRSMFDYLDSYLAEGKDSDFVRCANGCHQSGIYQAAFIKIREKGIDKPDALINYFTYFDSRPYRNSIADTVSAGRKAAGDAVYNRIVFGAPGTGKSYLLEQDSAPFGNHAERVTFHPNYSYANFVGTYKPVMIQNENGGKEMSYEYVPGPFMRIYTQAVNHPEENFLLLIEEINRANVAAVFGDVFQLLDRKNGVSEYPIAASEDIKAFLLNNLDCLKGKGADELSDEEKKVYLELRIPENMFIWATMNSADQGVFPMDTAFKRRWEFEYLGIDAGAEEVENYIIPVGDGNHRRYVKWNDLRERINDILSSDDCRVNEDKLLGPFFISKGMLESACKKEERFIKAFESKVIMYLFEDAVKMRPANIFKGHRGRMIFSEICKTFEEKGEGLFGIDDIEYVEKEEQE